MKFSDKPGVNVLTLNEEGRELDEKRSVKEPENNYKKKTRERLRRQRPLILLDIDGTMTDKSSRIEVVASLPKMIVLHSLCPALQPPY